MRPSIRSSRSSAEVPVVTGLAERRFEITLRNRVLFGAGEIRRLPEVIASVGGQRVLLVTDPGAAPAGLADRAVAASDTPATVYSEVEPNPSGATIERGAAALRSYGRDGTVIVAIGGGSAMDAAKAIALCAANERPVWE